MASFVINFASLSPASAWPSFSLNNVHKRGLKTPSFHFIDSQCAADGHGSPEVACWTSKTLTGSLVETCSGACFIINVTSLSPCAFLTHNTSLLCLWFSLWNIYINVVQRADNYRNHILTLNMKYFYVTVIY